MHCSTEAAQVHPKSAKKKKKSESSLYLDYSQRMFTRRFSQQIAQAASRRKTGCITLSFEQNITKQITKLQNSFVSIFRSSALFAVQREHVCMVAMLSKKLGQKM